MKKKMLLLMGIFFIGTIHAQVGINTLNPYGIFHIDPLANTGGTAAAPVNDTDDVTVNAKGYMGIGTANPQASLHIIGNTTIPALRIVDGTEQNLRLMTALDNDGNGEWQEQTLFAGKVVNGAGDLIIPFANKDQTFIWSNDDINGFSYTLTEAGLYAIELRFWGVVVGANDNSATGGVGVAGATAFHVRLLKNGALEDEYEGYAHVDRSVRFDREKITFFVTLYSQVTAAEALAGAVIRLTGRSGISPRSQGVLLYGGNTISYAWGHPKVGIKLIGE